MNEIGGFIWVNFWVHIFLGGSVSVGYFGFFFLLDIKMMILFCIIFGLIGKNYYKNLRRVSGLFM